MPICPKCRQIFADDIKVCPNDGEPLLPGNTISGVNKDLTSGYMVGEYRVDAKIGEGGFGTVYRGEHPLIGKKVAIKVLHTEFSSDPQIVSRFVSEARAVNKIRHKNIIDIFAFGVLDDGRQYFVMEYLDGMPFDQYLRQQGRLSIEAALPIFWRVAKALDAAHEAGIAHRDLKPENIFLTFDDEGTISPRLLDFGIAKLMRDNASGPKTRTGTPMGTPHYMSPEQCLGQNVDARTDIYSFGVMAFEILTGQKPFDADAVMQIFFMHMNEPAPSMSKIVPGLPPQLDAPVQAMMAKNADARPQTLIEAVRGLARAAVDAGFTVPEAYTAEGGITTGNQFANSAPLPPGTPVRVTPGARTPISAAEMIGDTLMATENMTPNTGSLNAPVPAKKGRGLLIGAVALVAVAVGAGGIFLLRPKHEATGSSPATSTSSVALASQVTSAAAPASTKTSAPAQASSTPPPATTTVTVTLQSTPKTVQIYQAGKKIGDSRGPLTLARGDAPVELTVTAPGHTPKKIRVTPTANVVVSVTLKKAYVHRVNKIKSKGEIENPF